MALLFGVLVGVWFALYCINALQCELAADRGAGGWSCKHTLSVVTYQNLSVKSERAIKSPLGLLNCIMYMMYTGINFRSNFRGPSILFIISTRSLSQHLVISAISDSPMLLLLLLLGFF